MLTFPILEVLPFTDNSAKLIFADAAMLIRLPYPGIYHRSRKCACLLVIDPPRTLCASDTIKKHRDDAGIIGSAGLATKAYPSTCVSREFAVEAYSRQENERLYPRQSYLRLNDRRLLPENAR